MIDLGGDVTGNGISKLVSRSSPPSPRRSATASGSGSPRSSATRRPAAAFSAGQSRSATGWTPKRELVPHEGEQAAIDEARVLKARGASLRTIAEALRAKGHTVSHVSVEPGSLLAA